MSKEKNNKFIITEKRKVACYKLLQGTKPSELGLEFNDAAILLTSFELMIKDQLEFMEKNNEHNPEKRATLTSIIQKAEELNQFFAEAAILTGEDA